MRMKNPILVFSTISSPGLIFYQAHKDGVLELMALFGEYDPDGDGFIEPDEIREAIITLN